MAALPGISLGIQITPGRQARHRARGTCRKPEGHLPALPGRKHGWRAPLRGRSWKLAVARRGSIGALLTNPPTSI